MTHHRALAVLLLSTLATIDFSSAYKTDVISITNETYCPDLNPQVDLDLEQIAGEWYVVEVIKHKVDPVRPTTSLHIVLETCPVVKIRFTSRRSLRLRWTEKAGNLEYSFMVADLVGAPGFWTSNGYQNGTLLTPKYTQFVGTVQVMKAVASHVVLTFCSRTSDNQIYSILLSRELDLPESDSKGVRNLLSRRGLTIASVQKTCTNSVARIESSYVTRWMMMILLTSALLAASLTTTTTTTNAFAI